MALTSERRSTSRSLDISTSACISRIIAIGKRVIDDAVSPRSAGPGPRWPNTREDMFPVCPTIGRPFAGLKTSTWDSKFERKTMAGLPWASRTGHILAFQPFGEPRVKLNFEAEPISSDRLGGVIFRVDCSHPCPANISASPIRLI
jgi:hypothetical protein